MKNLHRFSLVMAGQQAAYVRRTVLIRARPNIRTRFQHKPGNGLRASRGESQSGIVPGIFFNETSVVAFYP